MVRVYSSVGRLYDDDDDDDRGAITMVRNTSASEWFLFFFCFCCPIGWWWWWWLYVDTRTHTHTWTQWTCFFSWEKSKNQKKNCKQWGKQISVVNNREKHELKNCKSNKLSMSMSMMMMTWPLQPCNIGCHYNNGHLYFCLRCVYSVCLLMMNMNTWPMKVFKKWKIFMFVFTIFWT